MEYTGLDSSSLESRVEKYLAAIDPRSLNDYLQRPLYRTQAEGRIFRTPLGVGSIIPTSYKDKPPASFKTSDGCRGDWMFNRSTSYRSTLYRITTPQEKQMKQIDVQAIINLADTSLTDEMKDFSVLPVNIQEALKRRMASRDELKADAAAESIMLLLDKYDEQVKTYVESIRAARHIITQRKSQLDALKQARDVGMKTQNFVGLLHAIGYNVPTNLLPVEATAKTAKLKK